MSRKKPSKKAPKKSASPTKRSPPKKSTKAAFAKPIPVADSKQAKLIALLSSAKGATIEQMMQLTGWQAHSVRGVMSGSLKKRLGMTIETAKDSNGSRVYRILSAAG